MRRAILISSIFFVVSADVQCRPREIVDDVSDLCYAFQHVYANITVAREVCQKMGYDLASVHNAFQNSVFSSYGQSQLGITYGDFWIGALENLKTEKWEWHDGTPFNYQNWAPGEPEKDFRRCATLQVSNGLWSSLMCDSIKQFVCAGVPVFNTTEAPSTACPVCQCPKMNPKFELY